MLTGGALQFRLKGLRCSVQFVYSDVRWDVYMNWRSLLCDSLVMLCSIMIIFVRWCFVCAALSRRL